VTAPSESALRAALARAVAREPVPAAVLEAAFGEIVDGKASAVAAAGLLVALRTKGETVEEIAAAARALRARADTAPSPSAGAIDTCGTGGDGAGTFNVSTAAAFVVAGAGVPVAKHGNRAASSRAGSADVLEALGVRVDLPIARAAAIAREIGIGFLFARRAHPAMRHLAPVRAELGIRTLMNCLGPLVNPCGVRRQLVGVYAPDLVLPLVQALSQLGTESALVVHGSDGLDEITTTGPTSAARLADGRIESLSIDPAAYGVARSRLEDLRGGDAAENAAILRAVLGGESGARRDLVLVNAAAALWVAGAAADLGDGLEQARASIDSGAARAKLAALAAATQAAERVA
jgi:anthranilate phosphoribosyltransferase